MFGVTFVILVLIVASVAEFADEYSIMHFLDMAERQKSFVLKAWKLEHAWVNPSLVHDPKNDSRVIMVWRMPDKGRHDKVGYMWLDYPSFNYAKRKDMIELVNPGVFRTNLVGEDARIFNHNGRLYLVYNTHLAKFKKLFYREVVFNATEDMFYSLDPPRHVTFHGEINIRHQKNWTPFDFCPRCVFRRGSVVPTPSNALMDPTSPKTSAVDPSLLFVYSINPHLIVQVYPTNVTGEEVAETVYSSELLKGFEWKWGEMRGGSPALLINNDSYLSFFHSSGRISHKHIITYVMGAYMFDRNPPFAITHMSPEPIVEQSFVNASLGWAYKIVDFIVFPMGFTFDEQHIHVSYGKNDKDSWMLSLDKKGLLDSLVPVSTTVTGTSTYRPDTNTIERHTYNGNASRSSATGTSHPTTGTAKKHHHLNLHGGLV